jgi:hypothetical protein
MDLATQPRFEPHPGRLAYSAKEAAPMLGVCDKSVRRLILRGLIRPHAEVGGNHRFPATHSGRVGRRTIAAQAASLGLGLSA